MGDKSPVQYVSRPVTIEAMQITLDNLNEVAKWCKGFVRGESIRFVKPKPLRKPNADNSHYAISGDYVVRTKYGFTVVKPKVFEEKYHRYGA